MQTQRRPHVLQEECPIPSSQNQRNLPLSKLDSLVERRLWHAKMSHGRRRRQLLAVRTGDKDADDMDDSGLKLGRPVVSSAADRMVAFKRKAVDDDGAEEGRHRHPAVRARTTADDGDNWALGTGRFPFLILQARHFKSCVGDANTGEADPAWPLVNREEVEVPPWAAPVTMGRDARSLSLALSWQQRRIDLPNDDVSSEHAQLMWSTTEGWTLRDIGSLNGTWLNGTRLGEERKTSQATPLQAGDSIKLGNLSFLGLCPGLSYLESGTY
mmetsp:Transcript_13151/g.26685  ORF Transcript_13151/g.26685 Transcript_13151/m.26685 type:complete len:270 (-) Transcript_13151:385-1194(-)